MNTFNQLLVQKSTLGKGNGETFREEFESRHAAKRRHSISTSGFWRDPEKEKARRQETKKSGLQQIWDHFKNGNSSQNFINARLSKMRSILNNSTMTRRRSSNTGCKRQPEECKRLEEDLNDHDKTWRRWGPYLSERQWGTVREDYSHDGSR